MLASIRSSLVAPLAAPALRSVITQRVPDAVVRGDRNVSAKQLRLRLASVKSIQRITKNNTIPQARPIGLRINNIISQIPPASEEDSKDLKHLVIPISSDRGLCGGVNGAVSKQTKLLFHDLPKDTDIFVIGNKGEALLKRTHQINIKRLVSDCYKNPTSFALASEIAEEIATSAKFDKATMVYNQFKSSIAYNTVAEDIDSGEFMSERLAGFSEKYEFEDEFVETLWMQDMMNFCLATKVYSSLLEAATSECSARMQAMENATKNCGEMITKLTLQMNKARQAMITQELGEIVSGAAAVSEGK